MAVGVEDGQGRVVRWVMHMTWSMAVMTVALGTAWAGEMQVGFDQADYLAAVGTTVPVRVEFKSTSPVALFSYGVRVVYLAELGGVANASAIFVPSELDFNGVLGPGAYKEVGSGFGAVKGTVDFFANPIQYYAGSVLATFQVACPKVGEYDLALQLFRTLGPTEAVFVTAEGLVLDDVLSLGTAKVKVIPETGSAVLLGLGLLVLRGVRRC